MMRLIFDPLELMGVGPIIHTCPTCGYLLDENGDTLVWKFDKDTYTTQGEDMHWVLKSIGVYSQYITLQMSELK